MTPRVGLCVDFISIIHAVCTCGVCCVVYISFLFSNITHTVIASCVCSSMVLCVVCSVVKGMSALRVLVRTCVMRIAHGECAACVCLREGVGVCWLNMFFMPARCVVVCVVFSFCYTECAHGVCVGQRVWFSYVSHIHTHMQTCYVYNDIQLCQWLWYVPYTMRVVRAACVFLFLFACRRVFSLFTKHTSLHTRSVLVCLVFIYVTHTHTACVCRFACTVLRDFVCACTAHSHTYGAHCPLHTACAHGVCRSAWSSVCHTRRVRIACMRGLVLACVLFVLVTRTLCAWRV